MVKKILDNVSDSNICTSPMYMFANLGGLQDSFAMDFAVMFLNANYSVQMEENLIQHGMDSA